MVHCSDSDNVSHDSLETIKDWHLERGFDDIGYHYVITKKGPGALWIGRPLSIQGAHVIGHNDHTIAICLTGRNDFSGEQIITLKKLITNLKDIFRIKRDNIIGHCDLNFKKSCPNINMEILRCQIFNNQLGGY